ncbi:MAG TPA: hypothetical protein VJA19_10750 [Pseudomonas sp.]|nr:hypothetical protein [Pseudomonas sp.]
MKTSSLLFIAALFACTNQALAFESEQNRVDRTQAELDQRCEAAREIKLKPIRAQAFVECMSSKRGTDTEADCKRKTSGYNGNRQGGTPRFYDLPACEEAFKYRRSHP